MQQDIEQLKVLSGTSDLERIAACMPLKPFNKKICEFLSDVSKTIMVDAVAKQYADVTSFGFFCREANIKKLYEKANLSGEIRLGKGVVFHIAPGNVAVNFAYSLVMALLSGNASIVRISDKEFVQTDILVNIFNKVLQKEVFSWLVPYINIWSYPKQYKEITKIASEICNVRIIWGGDATINSIRRIPLMPKASEVTFADRCSICLMKAESVLETKELGGMVRKFYNDTYLNDQNACTSPFFIVWEGTGDVVEKAQKMFWDSVSEYIKHNYDIEASVVVDKLEKACEVSIALMDNVKVIKSDNYIYRLVIGELDKRIVEMRCAGGFFFEYSTESKDCIREIVNERFQTLSYFGYEKDELINWIREMDLSGIDRVTPMGQTMDFDYVWDGYDLIRTLSRRITVK